MTSSFGDTHEFGDGNAAWGDEDGESVDDGENHSSLPSAIDLGGGMRLVIPPEAFRTIMHTPEITSVTQERCEELADMANSLAVIEGAKYTYSVSNNPENIRARGRVKPANEAAKRDDAENSTLLKALAAVGSDPVPASYAARGFHGSNTLDDDETMSGPLPNISYAPEAEE